MAHQQHQRNKRSESSGDPLHAIFNGLFKGLWWLVTLPFQDKAKAGRLAQTRHQFQQSWSQIEKLAAQGRAKEAIMQADIMLDKALQFHGVAGGNLGERLKASTSRLARPILDLAWNAHKVRNRLAHELHYQLTDGEARQALSDFKKVLRELGLL